MDRQDVLITALKAAGAKMMTYDPSSVATQTKANIGDLVTAADLACEKIIEETIRATFPNDIVISEETTDNHDKLTPENLTQLSAWVVDPIDGTTNFKRGFTYSAVSIGYIQNGRPTLGGIFDPYHNNLYLAKLGGGATCNNQPIRVADASVFDFSTRVCTSNSYEKTADNLKLYSKLGQVWVDVLSSGVLDMSYIASGKIDLFFHNGSKPWDNAAGFLLAEEAGAKILDWQGQPTTWLASEFVMGNPKLVDLFVEKVNNP